MECSKMMETRQLILIKLLYIICILESAISLEDHSSSSVTTNALTCRECYQHPQPDIYQNVTYTSNHQMQPEPVNSTQTIQPVTTTTNSSSKSPYAYQGLNDTNSRSIYASLMKIFQQLKSQMKNNSQESNHSGEFAEAETIDVPEAVNHLRRSNQDWSLKNDIGDEKRFNRDTAKQSKRQSKYDSLPAVTIKSTAEDDQQEPTNTRNSQLNINFDDNNSSNNVKKTSYSKYLGPTIDIKTTKLRSDRKLNQQSNADNNWYSHDEYSPSIKSFDELMPSKQDIQPESSVPIYTTPGPEYLSSSQAFPSINDYPSAHHPFKMPYSSPAPEVKLSLDQAIRETSPNHQEPTILLVRKQRNHSPHKKTKSTNHYKSMASHRESMHLAQSPASYESHLMNEHDDPETAQTIKSSGNFGELGDELFRPKSNHPIYLQPLESKPASLQSSNQYLNQYLQLHPSASQKVYYTLATIPNTGGFKSMPATASHLKSVLGTSSQRDLLNQPQTIQITSVPPNGLGLNNPGATLVRVNGASLGGSFGAPGLDLPGLAGLSGFPGRQVLMVNSDRRLDWSWIIWPVAVVVALPLILSALFIPVFLKSIIIFIQILQSLGLVLPSAGLTHQLASNGSNLTSFN